jgi:hypothetical protein
MRYVIFLGFLNGILKRLADGNLEEEIDRV